MRDVVIIGAGPGGNDTAVYAKEHGLDVVLIEKGSVGGTCLNWGCIPTKTLYANATKIKDLKELDKFGIEVRDYSFNYATIKSRKEEIVTDQINNIIKTLDSLDIPLIKGEASIIDAHTVKVNNQTIKTKHIIIATGSKPKKLSFKGEELPIIKDSKDLLELTAFPKKLVVVGAGVIGCEMTSIFNELGANVTLVEYQKSILPTIDSSLARRAKSLLKRQGITIKTSSSLTAVKKENNTYKAIIETRKKEQHIETDMVLIATGRTPFYGNLDLDNLGITYGKNGIPVTANKQTNIPNVYAIGDVNGELLLAHKATFDGKKAINHILGNPCDIHFDEVPSVIFTIPEIASVGKTEDELKETAYKKAKYMFRTNAKAQTINETNGFVLLLVNEQNILVGGHIIGAHAADLIHELTTLIYKKTTVEELKNIIHAHPTISEVIQGAIEQF
ncbi:MAG: dihydrolipoyl dehydrogenase [Candidatus Izimaplasma sp.]|nr:dihydrolipoyl dehydrogenase [Candidatus Izimaplasma bacterium]